METFDADTERSSHPGRNRRWRGDRLHRGRPCAGGRAGAEHEGEFASGPQAGSKLPGTFEPVLLNTADAGEECCILCKFGNDPVVMVFAPNRAHARPARSRCWRKPRPPPRVRSGLCDRDRRPATRRRRRSRNSPRSSLKHVVLGVIDAPKLKRYSLQRRATGSSASHGDSCSIDGSRSSDR